MYLSKTTRQQTIQINVVEARKKIGQILEDVYYNDNKYILSRRGKPYAEIVRVKPSNVTQKRSLADIARSAQKHAGKRIDINEVMADIRGR